jgi:hypothetical protein
MSNSPPSSIFRRYKLSQAAQDGMLVICSCVYCRKQEAYAAGDLLAVYGDMAVEDFGSGGCVCGARNGVRTRTHYPGPGDIGRLELIRPAGWTQLWHWRKEWLDLPLRPLEDLDKPLTRREVERREGSRSAPKFERWDKTFV